MSNGNPDLRARVLAAVAAERSPARSAVRRRSRLVLLAGAGVAAAVFFAIGGVNLGVRPRDLVLVATSALALIAVAAIASVRGGRWLGPRHEGAALVALLPTFVLAAVTLIGHAAERGAAVPGSVDLACATLTALFAVPLGLSVLFWRRRSDPLYPTYTAAALAAATVAIAAVLVLVHCPHATVRHDLLGHALPALLPALVVTSLGRRLVRP